MTFDAHFGGKFIVPDEPVDLPLNQGLILQIQPVAHNDPPATGSALDWIAAHVVESPALPADLAARHDHYLYGRSSSDERSR